MDRIYGIVKTGVGAHATAWAQRFREFWLRKKGGRA